MNPSRANPDSVAPGSNGERCFGPHEIVVQDLPNVVGGTPGLLLLPDPERAHPGFEKTGFSRVSALPRNPQTSRERMPGGELWWKPLQAHVPAWTLSQADASAGPLAAWFPSAEAPLLDPTLWLDLQLSFSLHLRRVRASVGDPLNGAIANRRFTAPPGFICLPHLVVYVRGRSVLDVVVWELAHERLIEHWGGSLGAVEFWSNRPEWLVKLKRKVRQNALGSSMTEQELRRNLQNRYLSFRFVVENDVLLRTLWLEEQNAVVDSGGMRP
jgi:hypothetical protein